MSKPTAPRPEAPRVVYVTAGAAGMFCGSCMRDNAVAAGLIKLGMDVTLVPLYTPIRTEDEDISVDRIFFGGINVYLQQKMPLFRWLPRFADRWLDRPGLIRRVASRAMSVDAGELGAMTLSMARGEDGYQRKEVRRLVSWLRDDVRPDLVCLTNLLVGGSIPAIRREMPGVPVLVTLQGDDVFLDELTEPYREQVLTEMRRLAAQVDGFIVFNDHYRRLMSDLLDIPPDRFHRTALGVEEDHFVEVASARAREPKPAQVPRVVGYFARLCAEKGFDVLVEAFLDLARRPGFDDVRLHAGGWLAERDREHVARQEQRLRDAGLAGRYRNIGSPEMADKVEFFRDLDVFCVPARFVEPKGIYALEAMACGVPAVVPDHGAFPEMIADSGGGLLVPKEDPVATADALAALLTDRDERVRLGTRGHDWVVRACGREAMARTTAAVFERFLDR